MEKVKPKKKEGFSIYAEEVGENVFSLFLQKKMEKTEE